MKEEFCRSDMITLSFRQIVLRDRRKNEELKYPHRTTTALGIKRKFCCINKELFFPLAYSILDEMCEGGE